MSKKTAKRCPHCGAKMEEYVHRLTPALVTSLRVLEKAGGGPIKLRDLGLTHSQWDNFQKLRYFELVRKVLNEDGKRRGGFWVMTMRGRAFLNGSVSVFPRVWTYRGERVRYEGVPIRVTDVTGPHYQQRDDWAAEARPHAERT